jgi:hypothetical protein
MVGSVANMVPASSEQPRCSLLFEFAPWLLCTAVVLPLDDTPRASEILYGSHANPLSNAIHVSMSCSLQGIMSDPERLGFGE